jgi:hypothetical protein
MGVWSPVEATKGADLMDELMAAIQEKTGLPTEQATGAAQAAMDFFKEKLPPPMGDKLEDLISGNADAIAEATDGLTDKIKGMFTS